MGGWLRWLKVDWEVYIVAFVLEWKRSYELMEAGRWVLIALMFLRLPCFL